MALPIFLDVETSGLTLENRLLEIGFIVTNLDYKELTKGKLFVEDYGVDDEKSMRVVKWKRKKGMTSREVFQYFEELKTSLNVDRFVIFGWNVSFDVAFLLKFLGNKYYEIFSEKPIDVSSIYFYLFNENTSLKRALRNLRIKFDESKLHDSLYDVEVTLKLWERLRKVSLFK